MAGAVNISRDLLPGGEEELDLLLGLQIASPGGDLEPPREGGTGLGHAQMDGDKPSKAKDMRRKIHKGCWRAPPAESRLPVRRSPVEGSRMIRRSRPLLILPITFLVLLPPDGVWAPGRGHAPGHHHGPQSPLLQANARPQLAAVLRQGEPPAARAARGDAAEGGEPMGGEIDAPVH